MSQRSLYIGVDLREENSQLALLAPQGEEPKLVFDPRDKTENTQIPTVVTIPGSRETVGHFLEKLLKASRSLPPEWRATRSMYWRRIFRKYCPLRGASTRKE